MIGIEHPRAKLDAGTYATMGVGMGYAIASYAAYNFPRPEGVSGRSGSRKKIVCIEGDSAFGFSAIEVETMARYQMDVLIFVMNNSGVYRGDTNSSEKWLERQRNTVAGTTTEGKGLTAWSLGYETDYQKIAEMAGGIGIVVRTPDELREATKRGFEARVPVVVNVIVDPQADLEMVSCFRHVSGYESALLLRLILHADHDRTFHGLIWWDLRRRKQSSDVPISVDARTRCGKSVYTKSRRSSSVRFSTACKYVCLEYVTTA